jgi:ribosomal protein L7Ae-like RNA K-turn-binding protein
MIQFTQEFYDSIEKVKAKVLANDVHYNKEEFIHLAFCYSEINRVFFSRKKELKKGCGGCVNSAVRTIRNYINQYPTEPKAGKAKVTRVEVEKDYQNLKYPQLLKLANEKGFKGERRTKKDLLKFLEDGK